MTATELKTTAATATATITTATPGYELFPSVSREALIAHFGLPADTSEEAVDDHMMAALAVKHGLQPTASFEEVEHAQFVDHCRRFGIDPTAPDAHAALDARLYAPRPLKAA